MEQDAAGERELGPNGWADEFRIGRFLIRCELYSWIEKKRRMLGSRLGNKSRQTPFGLACPRDEPLSTVDNRNQLHLPVTHTKADETWRGQRGSIFADLQDGYCRGVWSVIAGQDGLEFMSH